MKKTIIAILLTAAGFLLGASTYKYIHSFDRLSLEQMHEQVVDQRDSGIEKAIAAGVYNCCVEPACTMCYMEANMWNNQTAGTCACAELIGQGKDPCPQCERMLEDHDSAACQLNSESECGNN